jgi:hypothetical protein
MSDLTITKLTDDECGQPEFPSHALDWLLAELEEHSAIDGFNVSVTDSWLVRSEKSDKTDGYVVQRTKAEGYAGGVTLAQWEDAGYTCTCPSYKWNSLFKPEKSDTPIDDFEAVETCKHGKSVREKDRRVPDRRDGQSALNEAVDEAIDESEGGE